MEPGDTSRQLVKSKRVKDQISVAYLESKPQKKDYKDRIVLAKIKSGAGPTVQSKLYKDSGSSPDKTIQVKDLQLMVNSATVFENIKHILFKPEIKKNDKCRNDSILTQHRIQKEQVKVLLNYLAGGIKAPEEEDVLWMDDCLTKIVIN